MPFGRPAGLRTPFTLLPDQAQIQHLKLDRDDPEDSVPEATLGLGVITRISVITPTTTPTHTPTTTLAQCHSGDRQDLEHPLPYFLITRHSHPTSTYSTYDIPSSKHLFQI